MAVKAWEQTDIRFAFCFPDPCEIGMSRLSITIPYEIINNLPCALCERVYIYGRCPANAWPGCMGSWTGCCP